VELWPSQREAARRSTDVKDDLVVALPTSAGKTRVAEIAALMTLSSARRVLIVTPLRPVSADGTVLSQDFRPARIQCVVSLWRKRTFCRRRRRPPFEGDRDRNTEKLDFALRSDPSLIDDVGLIVLDEVT